jgi:transketolase
MTDNKVFGDKYSELIFGLLDLHKDYILGDADLGRAIYGGNYQELRKKYPFQMFDVGIQEANLIGVACGLSLIGKIPIIHSFASFITRRTYDTLFVSGAYAGLNLTLIGSDPGITSAYNGGTHMTFEDVGLIRSIPNSVIFEPADNNQLSSMLPKIIGHNGIKYMRIIRREKPEIIYPEDTDFQIGKAKKLRDGKDVTIISMGFLVVSCLNAAEILEKRGISASVLDIVTVKPIDKEAVVDAALMTGAIVTVENHSLATGLNAAVGSVVVKNRPCPVLGVGVNERFGEVGSLQELTEIFHFRPEDIAKKVEECLSL